MNDSFLSVVAHRHEPDKLLVRARVDGDIERAFPGAVVFYTPDNDYPYRATIPRSAVAARLSCLIEGIEYENFKGSVRENDRHYAYSDVWRVMRGLQQAKKNKP